MILAMDSSGSMTATDVAPDRMTAAREAASSFVKDLPKGFRVGVVSFSDQADVVVPVTDDRDEALRGLSALQADNGTALGDAIARSVDLGVTSLDQELAAAKESDNAGRRARALRRREHDRRLRAARGGAEADNARCRSTRSRSGPTTARSRAGRLRRHADDPRSARSRDPGPGGRDDRRQVLRGRRPDSLKSVYDEIGSQVGVRTRSSGS